MILWLAPLITPWLIHPNRHPLCVRNGCLVCLIPALLRLAHPVLSPVPALVQGLREGMMVLLILPEVSGCLRHLTQILLGAPFPVDVPQLRPQGTTLCLLGIALIHLWVLCRLRSLSKGLEGPFQITPLPCGSVGSRSSSRPSRFSGGSSHVSRRSLSPSAMSSRLRSQFPDLSHNHSGLCSPSHPGEPEDW